jgi:hypothetical protein
MEARMDQAALTRTIERAQAAVRSDDEAAALEALRLARLASVDAIKLLGCLIRDDSAPLAQRTRASVSILECAGFLSGMVAAELRASTVLREAMNGDGAAARDAA